MGWMGKGYLADPRYLPDGQVLEEAHNGFPIRLQTKLPIGFVHIAAHLRQLPIWGNAFDDTTPTRKSEIYTRLAE